LTCTDSDGGKNYTVKGEVIANGDLVGYDYCYDSTSVLERFCEGAVADNFIWDCSGYKCKNGVCSDEISEGDEVDCVQSCFYEGGCLPIGARKKINDIQQYCNAEFVLIAQKEQGLKCENHFECRSNFCVDDTCLKQGFFIRIINWFRKMFGVDPLIPDLNQTVYKIKPEQNKSGKFNKTNKLNSKHLP